jgi:hypothetical protein
LVFWQNKCTYYYFFSQSDKIPEIAGQRTDSISNLAPGFSRSLGYCCKIHQGKAGSGKAYAKAANNFNGLKNPLKKTVFCMGFFITWIS